MNTPHFLSSLALLIAIVGLAQAQEEAPIILNDASPAIDVVVSLPPDTSGVIALEISGASVSLLDETQTPIFSESDPRIRALELRLAPNTGTHTLSVQRLAGIASAQVRIRALPDLSALSLTTSFVESSSLSLNQERALTLSPSAPGGNLRFTSPPEQLANVTANFAGAQVLGQLTDAQNSILASWNNDLDGVSFVLDGGDYQMALVGNQLQQESIAGVRLTPYDANSALLLQAPVTTETPNTPATTGVVCTGAIQPSSVNLRSGPGTGYSILTYAYRNESLNVGGTNRDGSWLVVANNAGTSAWVNRETLSLNGDCQALQVYDIPYREAQPAQIVVRPVTTVQEVIVPVAGNNASVNTGASYSDDDHDDEDHDDEHEDEGDDD